MIELPRGVSSFILAVVKIARFYRRYPNNIRQWIALVVPATKLPEVLNAVDILNEEADFFAKRPNSNNPQ